uniref:Type IV pilin n=1 Tax=Ignisphaera aggregans TaxID=334771 RepID=A0A7C2ZL51_9CREN
MKKLYKGIEPIIAVVILVAVTLVIAIGVIGWIMGWWGSMGATEQLQLYADSNLTVSSGGSGTLELRVANKGSASAVIYKVEIVGTACTVEISDDTPKNTGIDVDDKRGGVTVPPGTDGIIIYDIRGDNCNLIPGSVYQIKVYTKAGNVYPLTLTAQWRSSSS